MHLQIINYFAFADACGRFDTTSLPLQTKMELLVSDFTDSQAFQEKDGEFRDIATWPGLTFTEGGAISEINWEFDVFEAIMDDNYRPDINVGGSIDFRFLPDGVETVEIISFELSGTVTTSLLPDTIHFFDINDNRLAGEFDATRLPPAIIHLSVHRNDFEGEFRIDALPDTLERLDISENRFSGGLDLTQITAPIVYFYAEKNNFSGILNASKLPVSTKRVWVYGNGFKQDSLSVDAAHLDVCGLRVDEGTFAELVGVNGSLLNIQEEKTGLVITEKKKE